jgi:hypothetical protein
VKAIGVGFARDRFNMVTHHLSILNSTPILLLTLWMHAGGCSWNEALQAERTAGFTQQEQAIYTVILAKYSYAPSIVLMNETELMNATRGWEGEIEDENAYIIQKFGGNSPEPLGNLRKANRQSHFVPNDLTLGVPYHLLDQIALKNIIKSGRSEYDGRWNELHTQFPDANGIFTIAHVGFDESELVALAFLYWQAGPLAAFREYFILKREGDTWSIVDSIVTLRA